MSHSSVGFGLFVRGFAIDLTVRSFGGRIAAMSRRSRGSLAVITYSVGALWWQLWRDESGIVNRSIM